MGFAMKRIFIMSVCAMLALSPAVVMAGNADSGMAEIVSAKPEKKFKEVTFSVSMHCEKCVEKIRENISYEKGVKGLDISLEEKTVSVRYDASKTDEQTLSDAIAELGYEVKVKSRSCEGEDKVQYE